MKSSQFFPIVLISSLLFIQCLANANLIDDVCMKIKDVKFRFCVASFTSDRRSQNATMENQLGELSLEHLMSKASILTSRYSILAKKYPTKELQECSKIYAEAIPTLKEALNSYKAKDYPTTNIKVSAAFDASADCVEGFQGENKDPLQRMNSAFIKLAKISLSFVAVDSPALSKIVPNFKSGASLAVPKSGPSTISGASLAASKIGPNPTSGKSPLKLGAIAVQNLISKAQEITSAISQLQKDPKTNPPAKDALQYCYTSYSGFVKNLTEGLKGYEAKQYESLQGTLDTLTLDAQYCVDEFSNHNLKFPLMKQQGEFADLADAASASISFLGEV
ncbi:Pectinesterase inhibitor domain [Dillenia turbinata]|uniref:Pectinesterase inhibitor domain n=1 Tax=Dillenia turbinata TaxID=194707 RepID=A0AAN8VJX6_9MAGN